jgi:hypothetical protein
MNRVYGPKGLAERISHAPATYLECYLRKAALLWGWEIGLGSGDIHLYPTQNSPFIVNPLMKAIKAVAYIFNGVLTVIALAALTIVAVHRESSAGILTFAVTSAWITATYAVVKSDPRYSIPFLSAEMALACVAVTAFQDRVRHLTRGPSDLAQ